jgi:hypothetical protein
VGRRVNPGRFDAIYTRYRALYAPSVLAPIAVDVRDEDNDYFKFNLDTITLYTLIRFEDSAYHRWWYTQAYTSLRRTTDGHSNAHFNMIDRGVRGPDGRRDAETRELLAAWLTRPRRDAGWIGVGSIRPAAARTGPALPCAWWIAGALTFCGSAARSVWSAGERG